MTLIAHHDTYPQHGSAGNIVIGLACLRCDMHVSGSDNFACASLLHTCLAVIHAVYFSLCNCPCNPTMYVGRLKAQETLQDWITP